MNRSQNDLHPDVGPSIYRTPQSLDSVPKKRFSLWEEFTKRFHAAPLRFVQEKKARCSSQLKCHSGNTLATNEENQILLIPQNLATNNNSGNFNSNISEIYTPSKSLTTTKLPTFDGKTDNFELFEDFFQTSRKIYIQQTEEDKLNYVTLLLSDNSLQMFRSTSNPTRYTLEKIKTVFHGNYVNTKSMATSRLKFWRLVFNPAEPKTNWTIHLNFFCFPSKNLFERDTSSSSSVVGISPLFLTFRKMRSFPIFQEITVGVLCYTDMWLSLQLGSQSWMVRIPLLVLVFNFF